MCLCEPMLCRYWQQEKVVNVVSHSSGSAQAIGIKFPWCISAACYFTNRLNATWASKAQGISSCKAAKCKLLKHTYICKISLCQNEKWNQTKVNSSTQSQLTVVGFPLRAPDYPWCKPSVPGSRVREASLSNADSSPQSASHTLWKIRFNHCIRRRRQEEEREEGRGVIRHHGLSPMLPRQKAPWLWIQGQGWVLRGERVKKNTDSQSDQSWEADAGYRLYIKLEDLQVEQSMWHKSKDGGRCEHLL